ncbi:GNAT family N-acetyltransferase, partial [Candidatus Microgenomates bacterium]|nr:GNAT family N-acetyltransferase [Candidatus Microgenomates bacterium]
QIDPDLQGKGYGKQLYEYIETDFRRNNIQQISLYSTLNAIEFYKNLGFEITKEIKYPLVKTKMDMVEMKKILTHPHS